MSSLNNKRSRFQVSGSRWGSTWNLKLGTRNLRVLAVLLSVALSAGCARNIKLKPLPAAKGGSATVKVELTYNRNDQLTIKLQGPEPAAYGPEFTAYVAWVGTPDGKHAANVGRIRVEGGKGQLVTITPLRKFRLFLTVEKEGDVMQPGPQVVYEAAKEIEW